MALQRNELASRGSVRSRTALFPPCGIQGVVRKLPRSTISILRTASGPLPEQIAESVQHQVHAFAGSAYGQRRRLIQEAVACAIADFFDLLMMQPAGHRAVDDLFSGMGFAEAVDGRRIGPMLHAFEVATADIWAAIERLLQWHQMSATVVVDIGSMLNAYMAHLMNQIQRGHLSARAADQSPRQRLFNALMGHASPVRLRELAAVVGWSLPEHVVVLVADPGRQGRSTVVGLPSKHLICFDRGRIVLVAAAGESDAACDPIAELAGDSSIALSWPVPLAEAPDAYRWADRALRLNRAGLITGHGQILDCAEHRMTLWMEADPPLRQQVSAELLMPLMALKPHQRHVVAETLLRHLTTDEAAPAMARHLGVHPQTVRNHLHRLKEMLGPIMDDPNQRMRLAFALEALLPQWRAADISGKAAPTTTGHQ